MEGSLYLYVMWRSSRNPGPLHKLPVADVDVFLGKGNLFGGMTETGAPKGLIVAVCKGITVGIVVGWWWKKVEEPACWWITAFEGWAAIWIMIGWTLAVVVPAAVTTTEVAVVVELLFSTMASSIDCCSGTVIN